MSAIDDSLRPIELDIPKGSVLTISIDRKTGMFNVILTHEPSGIETRRSGAVRRQVIQEALDEILSLIPMDQLVNTELPPGVNRDPNTIGSKL